MKKFMILAIVLISTAVLAQNGGGRPKIAVYVADDDVGVSRATSRALATRLLEAFVRSGRYTAVERSDAFVAEINKEQQAQRSGAVDDEQISRLGRQSGVQFVCVANITHALGSYQVSARIIDVETANVVAIGVADSPLQVMNDLTGVSRDIVAAMFGDGAAAATDRRTDMRPTPAPTGDGTTYLLTTNVEPSGSGLIHRNPDRPRYNAGTLVTITAAPNPGYRFVGWSGAVTSAKTGVTGQMNRDMTLTANFQETAGGTPSVENAKRASSIKHYESEPKLPKYYLEFYLPLLASPHSGATGEWTAIEGGWIRENGMYLGLEFGGGYFGNMELFGTNTGDRGWVGGGVNIGMITPKRRFAYGLSAGAWGGYIDLEQTTSGWSSQTQTESHSFLGFSGLFFKIRWKYIGIMYRGILGYGEEKTLRNGIVQDRDKGFHYAWQVKLSLHLGLINR